MIILDATNASTNAAEMHKDDNDGKEQGGVMSLADPPSIWSLSKFWLMFPLYWNRNCYR